MVEVLSATSSPAWACDPYDWCAPEGITRLSNILHDKVPYEVTPWQLKATAKILMGRHCMCNWATGEGKSSVFYLHSFVRPGTMTIVVCPTNALEEDLVKRLAKLGLHAVAINQESLNTASSMTPTRDLWSEMKNGAVNTILLSPEMLLSPCFKDAIRNERVRSRLALLCVDECHLVDEWGLDFRKPYGRISETIPWLPTWTARCGLTATLEPGRQTQIVMQALGFRDGNFFFDRRDCERYNVDVVLRAVQYTYSTDEFHDLDWLVPSTIASAADVPKTLIYCETIDLGHRVAAYLRTLLPLALQPHRNTIIRHAHSLNCPTCKTDILDALYQTGNERATAIVVATDVLGVGMDMPDCDQVICFLTPSSISSMIQRIGRTSRARDRHGTAYVYIKKADIEAVTYFMQMSSLSDPRFPTAASETLPLLSKNPPKKITTRVKSDVFIKNLSLWAIVAAYILNVCIVRQMNIIQGNPGIDRECGRCSSCSPRPLPCPRTASLPMSSSTKPDSSCTDHALKSYLKLKSADVDVLKQQLEDIAFKIHSKGPERAEDLFVGYRVFLDPCWIAKITDRFMLITSKEVLKARLEGWEYWDTHGDALWDEVGGLVEMMRLELEQRRVELLQQRREKRKEKALEEEEVRMHNAAVGLGDVKRVVLRVRTPLDVTHTSGAGGDKENAQHNDASVNAFSVAGADVGGRSSRASTPISPKRTSQPLDIELTNTPRKKKKQRL